MVEYHTKLILEAHRLIVKFISPSGKKFFFDILVSLHSSWKGLSIDMHLVVVGNCCTCHHMLDNHTKLILEAHQLIVKYISLSGKGFLRNVLVSLHCSWKGLSIDMYLLGGWELLYLTSYGRQSHETDFRSTSTHCEIYLTLRQKIFLVSFGIAA